MNIWEVNARTAEVEYGMLVDWNERFYICPECGERVYEKDWTNKALMDEFCPVCGFTGEED